VDFVSIKISNFLSYQSQEFTGLDKPGLTLIEGVNRDEGGSNGADKSSPWDSLAWCLFGQTVRGLKGDEVINRTAKKDCSVSVSFAHKEKDWVVTRYRKHSEFSNRLVVSVDGKSRESGTTALAQENLLHELGIDFDLFRCTIVFAQGETFNFIDENNKKQKEILSKVMRINFEDASRKTKRAIMSHTSEANEFGEKVLILNSHKCDPDKKYAEDVANWEESRRTSIKEFEDGISSQRAMISHAKSKIKPTEELIGLKEKLIESLNFTKDGARSMVERRGKVKGMIHHWETRVKDLSSLDGECPRCAQPISKKEMEKSIDEAQEKLTSYIHALTGLDKAVDNLESRVAVHREKMERIDEAIVEHREMVSDLKRHQEDLAGMIEAKKAFELEECPWTGAIEKEREKQVKIEESIIKIEAKIEGIEERLLYLKFWETGFGDAGIKSFVFDLICSSLTERANAYVNLLTNGQVIVDFDTQKQLKTGELRDKFDVSLMTGGERIKYDSYSGGEKRRISLATDIALSDIMSDYYGSSFSFVVFDEQSNYLDTQGRECFTSLLKEIAKKKRVLVVDHDSEMKAKFDDSWVIEKKAGVSRLVG